MGDLLVHVYINERLEASRIFTNTTVSQHLFEGRQVNLNNLERFRFKNYQTSGGQVSIMLYPGYILQEAKQVVQVAPDNDLIPLTNQRCFDFRVTTAEPIKVINIPLGTKVQEYSGYQVYDTYQYHEDPATQVSEARKENNEPGFKIKVKNPYKK